MGKKSEVIGLPEAPAAKPTEQQVEAECCWIEQTKVELARRSEALRELVRDHGEPAGEGNSRRIGRASAVESKTKPTLSQTRALDYLTRYKKDLLDELTERSVKAKEFAAAVLADKIPAAQFKACLDPADPHWELRIAKKA